MSTLRTTTLLCSLASLIITACARRVAPEATPMPVALQFSNEGRDRVDVYLVTPEREWLLGRVEPLHVTRLPLPGGALSVIGRSVRLAVIPAASLTLRPSRERGVVMSMQQPIVDLLEQRWLFVGGQLSSLRHPNRTR